MGHVECVEKISCMRNLLQIDPHLCTKSIGERNIFFAMNFFSLYCAGLSQVCASFLGFTFLPVHLWWPRARFSSSGCWFFLL